MKKSGFEGSQKAYNNALKVMPGGVNSPVRAFGGMDIGPLVIARAEGSRIYDIDGNTFIDYVCSWGPMIVGHGHERVIEAIREATEKGTSFGAPTEAETELAEKIISSFRSIDKVRLVNSGTEAAMTAIRLARGYTGRDIIIKMAGCYHGHSDCLLVNAGSGVAEHGTASSAGVPSGIAELTIVVDYNDIEAVKEVFSRYPGKIAGIIVEPIAANMGVILPQEGYLESLREICSAEGSVLIFDEVITGFRVAHGGAQALYGVEADITCLGKIIGGGLPLAAFGGRDEIMHQLSPVGPVYQAGTLSGNPLATAAANATLGILLQGNPYQRLEEKSKMLEKGFIRAAERASIDVTINRVGSLMSCFFTQGPVMTFDDVCQSNLSQFKKYYIEMLNRGIYLAPSAYEAMFISLAHSTEDIECTISAAENAFLQLNDK